MKAAVVNAFGTSPSFQEFREPRAGDGEAIVTVHAAALSPIVRSLAAGRHYTSGATAGFVAGVDGVGVDDTGRRVYFLFPKPPFGSMAERALVARDAMVPVPEALTSERAAAVATAGLASWIALTRRARLERGERVLVLGATGAAGGMALRTARHLGAGTVVAAGRDRAKLDRLAADRTVAADDADGLRRVLEDGIDVILDFVWGEPAQRVLELVPRGARTGEPRRRWVQLGTVAGDAIRLRGDLLRSTGLELLGSGIGSVPVHELVAGAAELLAAAPAADFDTTFTALPLHAVGEAWSGDPSVRYVLLPR